jgi:hypothetical protein
MEKQFPRKDIQRLPRKKRSRVCQAENSVCEAETKGNFGQECKRSFGYLSRRPKGEEIPGDCISCMKMVDCILIAVRT